MLQLFHKMADNTMFSTISETEAASAAMASLSLADAGTEAYDLLILVDSTYSMSDYLDSLQTSLPQIISISALTDCFSRIGLLAYKDYCDKKLLDWSGWLEPSKFDFELDPANEMHGVKGGQPDLMAMAKGLEPFGGGDEPEATKTGLARAYELMRTDTTTIILLYTDAPPHTFANGQLGEEYSQLGPELEALNNHSSYGGFGPKFTDWVSAAKTLRSNKKAQVFSILDARDMSFAEAGYYNYLSSMTRGSCFYLQDSAPGTISKVTVEILLAWMGAEKAGAESAEFPAYLTRYVSGEDIKKIKYEEDRAANKFFYTTSSARTGKNGRTIEGSDNITKTRLSSGVLKRHLPKKTTPVHDFAKRYKVDDAYKNTAIQHIRKTVEDDVAAISLNPVFGSLWRTVCNDRDNEARDELVTLFGLRVDDIKHADEKARMKSWLEESYDYTAEVLGIIESVPESQRFPCVCLDPTLAFTREIYDSEEEPEDDKVITLFRRDELLEIGRSCDYKILRRLGRVLTRLTYINSAEEMPAHISTTSEEQMPRVPMSLAAPEHKRAFWKILLHIVVPGTMLSARPAALLAALSIRLGIQPLLAAADQEMKLWKNRWNNLDVPETWNVSCLSLILDANEAYQARHENDTLLKASDRSLFERLVTYKLLELNLDTSLTVQTGWTPDKTKAAMGAVAICRSCQYPRSVTIMGAQGKCGHCLWTEYSSPEERQAYITAHATQEDDEKTVQTWVECFVRTCRSQYVVYCTEALNVRPKCHYCRHSQLAPVIECTGCLNRVTWPKAYRPKGFSNFKCYACLAHRKTIVDIETTAAKLSKENTTGWLVQTGKTAAALEIFSKRSLFQTILTVGTEPFASGVLLFPEKVGTSLTLNGKLVRNNPVTELKSWISRRKAETGECSLCFSSKRKTDLMLACGRSGCSQLICKTCLQGWYGLNGPGRIINTAALSCAFCRRTPAPQTLSKYGMGVHAVADLKKAVKESGTWISAWCIACAHAKQYMERICAAGAPRDLKDWHCLDCDEDFERQLERDCQRARMYKTCPGCGTMTEKIGGCNHMQCRATGCGVHWCWYCENRFSRGSIYEHMVREHGGYYAGVEDEAYSDDEEDDY